MTSKCREAAVRRCAVLFSSEAKDTLRNSPKTFFFPIPQPPFVLTGERLPFESQDS